MSAIDTKRNVAALALGLCTLSGTAYAQELRDFFKTVPPSPMAEGDIRDWTGYYLGADISAHGASVDYVSPFGLPLTYGSEGLGLSIFGGHNWRMQEQWLWGIEGTIGFADTAHSPVPGFEPLLQTPSRVELALRAGALMSPRTLAYSRLGLGAMMLETRSGFAGADQDMQGMYTVGLGVETRLSDRLNGRIELRRAQVFETLTNPAGAEFTPQDTGLHIGLSYQFGENGMSPDALIERVQPDFTGPYVGLILGTANGNMATLIEGTRNATTGDDRPTYGIVAGYDHVFKENWLVGAELSYQVLDQDYLDGRGNALTAAQESRFASANDMTAYALRFGYLVTPETLVYTKVGQARITFDTNEEFYALTGGGSGTFEGLQWGIGVETPVWKQMTLRLEGVHFEADRIFVLDNNQNEQIALDASSFGANISLNWRW